jgi:hypothetical protein
MRKLGLAEVKNLAQTTIPMHLRETRKGFDPLTGAKLRGRPYGSKVYAEISQESKFAMIPVIVKCNDTLIKYLNSGLLQHIQITGNKTFLVFKDSTIVEV